MKKSTTLIQFFIRVAILAVAYGFPDLFSQGGEDPFEIITLGETTNCMT